ncbi:Na+/H+ antiporter [Oscillochloris sp. ZM17-4]|uniref:Na+/H+ antiporter n=1 Tax=Oscillochloris sp. ZM17-4 TaxID=2866714 RepID=UPI001C73C043|nr:Na+/H+ antiporter [Oscillochloris sp. ZM17-4]MBX0330044.1 Na+/H+ antiporter [Oscillochloris sp. ZM17-4]
MEQFLATETLVIELLLVVSLVAIGVRRLRLPYTVALVIVGLLITFNQEVRLELTPELILALFVPPLVFEAAFHIEFDRLRDNLLPILLLAIPGVLLTTAIVGLIVSAAAGVSLSTGLVFGALIAATDPVAVVALFRAVGAPKPLTVIVEGESLFNDGTAIVLFNLLLAAALASAGGGEAAGSLPTQILAAVIDFLRVAAGGVIVGVSMGLVVAWLIGRIDDYLIETTLTTVLAFGAYLIAERLHVSGVLAVVSAGIVCGNVGPRGMSPTTRIVLFNFWEYLAFVANSLVFLLIGLDVNIPQMLPYLLPIGIAVAAVIASRALVIYSISWLANIRGRRVPLTYQHVLFWGGLRGAISLALALSLPTSFADRDLLRVMTFGVVLFTLLAQGTTMSPLLRRLGLIQREELALEYERRHGRLMAARAARERVQQLTRAGMISAATSDQVSAHLDGRIDEASQAQRELLEEHPHLRDEERDDARREGLRAERAMLTSLSSGGVISERVYEELVSEVDARLEE